MRDAFGARLDAPPGIDKLIDDNRLGRKNGRGFYAYGDDKKGVDTTVYDVLGVKPNNRRVTAEEIGWRCALRFVDEACRCFEEGILRSARDGDIGAVFGLGFPPFRGGPFRFVDTVGPKVIVERLEALERAHGKRFAPAGILLDMARQGKTFHGDNPVSPGPQPPSDRKSRPQPHV